MEVAVLHLGEESTRQITKLVCETLGARASELSDIKAALSSTAAILVLVVECEQDGGHCGPGTAARKFLRELKKSETFATASTQRKVACLALARSVCANSAAMLGADKWKGGGMVQSAVVAAGCVPLVAMGTAEIELEEVEDSVLPWARLVSSALDAEATASNQPEGNEPMAPAAAAATHAKEEAQPTQRSPTRPTALLAAGAALVLLGVLSVKLLRRQGR